VGTELTKYGTVTDVMIFEVTTPGYAPEEAVRIFVQFDRTEAATRALVDLQGRFFGGRQVRRCRRGGTAAAAPCGNSSAACMCCVALNCRMDVKSGNARRHQAAAAFLVNAVRLACATQCVAYSVRGGCGTNAAGCQCSSCRSALS
jgi:hypothetical protein